MTFCISGRIALFTLGFMTHGGDEERSGSDNMVTEGSGENRNGTLKKGFYIEMWVRPPYLHVAAEAV